MKAPRRGLQYNRPASTKHPAVAGRRAQRPRSNPRRTSRALSARPWPRTCRPTWEPRETEFVAAVCRGAGGARTSQAPTNDCSRDACSPGDLSARVHVAAKHATQHARVSTKHATQHARAPVHGCAAKHATQHGVKQAQFARRPFRPCSPWQRGFATAEPQRQRGRSRKLAAPAAAEPRGALWCLPFLLRAWAFQVSRVKKQLKSDRLRLIMVSSCPTRTGWAGL